MDIITRVMEYLNPAEYDPVVILPKNNPDNQDCTKIAMPNNSKRELDSTRKGINYQQCCKSCNSYEYKPNQHIWF